MDDQMIGQNCPSGFERTKPSLVGTSVGIEVDSDDCNGRSAIGIMQREFPIADGEGVQKRSQRRSVGDFGNNRKGGFRLIGIR